MVVNVDTLKMQLLKWIDDDKQKLINFLSGFIQAKSPNPPGHTREAAQYITDFLDQNKLPYRIIAPQEEMVNIVARARKLWDNSWWFEGEYDPWLCGD